MNQKELHLLLREDLSKLNQIKEETRLLCRCHIDTAEQLFRGRKLVKAGENSWWMSAHISGIDSEAQRMRMCRKR